MKITRILYYIRFNSTIMSSWQYFHFIDELERHNCEIDIFNINEYQSIKDANANVITRCKNSEYDLFMTPYGTKELFNETLLSIKKMSVPTLLICFDNLVAPYIHRDNCMYFDLVWLTSEVNRDMFINWGANRIVVQPYAANPYIFHNDETGIESNKCTFLGTPYGSRTNMINTLLKNEVFVDLYGKIGYSTSGKNNKPTINECIKTASEYVRYESGRKLLKAALKQKILKNNELIVNSEYLKMYNLVDIDKQYSIYSKYSLSLSSTTARNTGVLKNPVFIVNLRSFEIAMSGGIQFCKFNKELSCYFEEDKEIVFYRNDKEMIEKAKYYLDVNNKVVRDKIRLNARKRAIENHTWYIRFINVFKELGINYE